MTSKLRPDRWTAGDRFLAAAFVAYGLVGIAGNYARVSPWVSAGVRGALAMVAMVALGLALLFFASELVRRRRSVETLGFNVGTWPSLALTVVVGLYLAFSPSEVSLTTVSAAGIGVPLLSVLVEEILFRPVLISCVRGRLTRTRRSWVLAVVWSAAFWTAARQRRRGRGRHHVRTLSSAGSRRAAY